VNFVQTRIYAKEHDWESKRAGRDGWPEPVCSNSAFFAVHTQLGTPSQLRCLPILGHPPVHPKKEKRYRCAAKSFQARPRWKARNGKIPTKDGPVAHLLPCYFCPRHPRRTDDAYWFASPNSRHPGSLFEPSVTISRLLIGGGVEERRG
jgi:hypothetical protein